MIRAGRRLLAEVQPHSSEEIEVYERHFGLPRSVVRPLPWSTSLTGYGHVTRRDEPGDAIVCGGHSYRDYPTLFAALRDAPWPLRVGLPRAPGTEAIVRAAADLPQVRIERDWGYADYWQQVYIRHGENGFLVPEGDAQAWRAALDLAWNLPAPVRKRITDAARADALERHSEVQRLLNTLDRAVEATQAARPGWAVAAGRRRWWMAFGAATSTALLAASAVQN